MLPCNNEGKKDQQKEDYILELNPQIFSESTSATEIWKFDSTI